MKTKVLVVIDIEGKGLMSLSTGILTCSLLRYSNEGSWYQKLICDLVEQRLTYLLWR